jgi:general stress protein 26
MGTPGAALMSAIFAGEYHAHMTTQIDDPQIAPFSKFRDLTADIHVTMLTTRRADGLLHSRPMGTRAIEADGALWFFTADDSGKVQEIYHDQMVNVSYVKPGDQVYVSVAGKASLSRDRAKIRELWTPALKTWFSEGVEDPNLALLRVDILAIDYWEGPGKIVTLLKFAKSAITGTPSKVGDHGSIVPPRETIV